MAIGWNDHHKEIANYLARTVGLGASPATPLLIVIKLVELLLVLITLAGVLRRKDVWFLPALLGWMAGFAAFCVLDLWAGFMGRLLEHVVYLMAFTMLLLMSYALSVKVRVGRPVQPTGTGDVPAPKNLTRTQEMALSAVNRWQRSIQPNRSPHP